ncbi:MAG: hypothetical protein ACI3Y9_09020 [Candidatus Cryptobacteroides sp.]
MKNSIIYILACSALVASCDFDEHWGPNLPARTEKTMEITATAADKSWAEGDKLLVLYRNERSGYWSSDASEFTCDASGKFSGRVSIKSGANYWAAYSNFSADQTIAFSTAATTQKGYGNRNHIATAMPYCGSTNGELVAGNESPSIELKKAGAILQISVTNQLEEAVRISEITVNASQPLGGEYLPKFEDDKADYKLLSGTGPAVLAVDSNEDIPVGGSADFYLVVKPFTLPAGETVSVSVKTSIGEKDASIKLKESVSAKAGQTIALSGEISDFSTVNGEPFKPCTFAGFALATVNLKSGSIVEFGRMENLKKALQPTFWDCISGDEATFKGEDGTYLLYKDGSTGLIYTEFPITEGYPATLWARGADNASGHPGGTVGTATWAGNGNPTNRQCCRRISNNVYEIYLYLANEGGFRLYQFTNSTPGYWIQTGLSGATPYTISYNGSTFTSGDDMPCPGEPGTYKVVIDMNTCTGTYTLIE